MNNLQRTWLFMAISYGLILVLPIAFLAKSLFEPEGWFFYSAWRPWLMFAALEILSIINFIICKKQLEKSWRDSELNRKWKEKHE